MSEMSTTWATKYDGAVSDDLKYWVELILNYFMEQASHLGLFSLWAKSHGRMPHDGGIPIARMRIPPRVW